MKILLVTPWSLDAAGGVSNVVATLYREFAAAGHEVLAFVPGPSAALSRGKDAGGRDVCGLFLRSPAHRDQPVRAWLTFLLFLPVTLWRLAVLLRNERIDVVHVHYPLPAFVYFGWLRRLRGGRLVITYHGNDAHDLNDWLPLERRLIRSLVEAADCVIAVSASLLAKVREQLPGVAIRGMALPNGAPVERIAANRSAPPVALPPRFVVSVGHLIRRKGVDLMVRALALLRERGLRVPLVLVGDGPDRAEFETLAAELGVADEVRFLGTLAHEQAISVVKASELFVLASRAEGFPLVLGEAMACHKTVVATAIDGVPELVVDGTNGLLVAPENPGALADAIARLWSDAGLRETLADRAHAQIVRDYSWTTVARRYLEQYTANPR